MSPLVRQGWRRTLGCLLVALAGATAWSCGTARRGEPLRGPLRLDDPREQRGEIVFARYCNKCHPGGEAGLGPGLNDKPIPNFLKRYQVRHGMGVMPAFKANVITDEQLDDLIQYLEALRAHRR